MGGYSVEWKDCCFSLVVVFVAPIDFLQRVAAVRVISIESDIFIAVRVIAVVFTLCWG